MKYLKRVADGLLRDRLRHAGAILIEGPKSCGKTATAGQVAASRLQLDTDPSVADAMAVDPGILLAGDTPRLLDEWQEQPTLWNHVRHAVDDRGEPGQFILTGSSVPRDDVRRHSGAGRFSRMRMRPMSLWESGASTGEVSLGGLLEGEDPRSARSELTVGDLADLVVRGGWPATHRYDRDQARQYVLDYVGLLTEVDVPNVAGGHRDPVRVRRLLASLARNVASEASISTIARDIAGGDDVGLARDTVRDYLTSLVRLMVVEDQEAWNVALRSSARLRKASKRHFVDPSLVVAALEIDESALVGDLNTLGLMFESMVIRDLRVYAEAAGGRILHYRDSSDREIDAVIEFPGGRWVACEVKLGAGAVDQGAASLTRAVAAIDTDRIGSPVAMVVVTGSGFAYRRADGVNVVPIGTLRP